ncbi:S41 family peptidase [Rhizobacter sp. LjRoot28]|uniref:S41 family peptidase n=1 Tax=Rhizobacter sp. LjRoot28 TaxID=3342309 RepID=UPI003ECE89CE
MRFLLRTAACAALVLLASCGGGSNDPYDRSFVCSATDDKRWLQAYMSENYFWAGRSPVAAPDDYADVDAYLDALRFKGDADEPADRFSYIDTRASFDQFFVEGRTVGYGVSVNGVEATLPLKIRYVDPGSPAAAAGLRRGDTVVAANGTPAAQLVASKDFSVLSPSRENDVLTLEVESGGVARKVPLTSATYALVPVTATSVFTLANGSKAGYVSLKDFIVQAETPLAESIAQIRQAGATELILDLRYNGGGRVSTAAQLGSLVTGATHAGKLFTQLVFNPRRQSLNSNYWLQNRPGPAFPRVVVLTGSRTCSASEMVVNGLKPYADVVTIGGTSCGKPVGFTPQDWCDNVYSIVNFESLNANGQGRYYDGLPLTCPVTDDFNRELGDPAEKLTAAAIGYLQTGSCPATAGGTAGTASLLQRANATRVIEPGQRSGMWAD